MNHKESCTIARMDGLSAISRRETRTLATETAPETTDLPRLSEVRWDSRWLHAAYMTLQSKPVGTSQYRCLLLKEDTVLHLVSAQDSFHALQKAAIKVGTAAEGCVLFLEGNISAAMVTIAVQAKCSVLAATGVPTAQAVCLARQCQLNLLCAVTRGSVDIYASRGLWDAAL